MNSQISIAASESSASQKSQRSLRTGRTVPFGDASNTYLNSQKSDLKRKTQKPIGGFLKNRDKKR